MKYGPDYKLCACSSGGVGKGGREEGKGRAGERKGRAGRGGNMNNHSLRSDNI